MKSIWHDIPWFSRYQFCWKYNEVKNKSTWYILKNRIKNWALCIWIQDDYWKLRTLSLWRITLLIKKWPKPPWLMCCHNDGNTNNNYPSNVRYDTNSWNMKDRCLHWTHNLKPRRKIRQYSLDWRIIKDYPSVAEANLAMWKVSWWISAVARWERNQAYWYRWVFLQ